jgi:uncharacterized membrane protein
MSEQKPQPDKSSQKTWAGMPVSWDTKNWYKGLWNPEDERLFPPKRVGIGWSFNFHALLKKLRILR